MDTAEKLKKVLEDKAPKVEEHTARELSKELGDFKERLTGDKSVLVVMRNRERPEVHFTGFWTGKFITAAVNAIAKAYRTRRYKPIRPHAGVKGGAGDVSV